MRDVNRRRKGSLGLGGPSDKPNHPMGEYIYTYIHNLIYINPHYENMQMQDSL